MKTGIAPFQPGSVTPAAGITDAGYSFAAA